MPNLSPTTVLTDTFGYQSFRHHQADIINSLINGNDVLTLMPTGGGKSLCYQIPAMVRKGVGIVISPLIALMKDQVDALKQLNIRAAYLNSTLNNEQIREIESQLRRGELTLLYIAPERLLNQRTLNLIQQLDVSLFAIDEAHCVSQWGHDFRKEYQQLSVLHEYFPSVPRIALTATADNRTRTEIIEQLGLSNADVYVNSFDRPNIHYELSEGQNAREQLWRFLQKNHGSDAGIIYCLSRKKVETTAAWLSKKGRNALPYHAGLSHEERETNQSRFLREENIIIVATIAFGMGIDKPDVRFVAHLNLPKSIEAYYQETGRAGRDGLPANAWMAYGLQDVILLRQMLQSADANEQYKRVTNHKLDAMLSLCEMTSCRRQALLEYFDETSHKPCGNCDNCLKPPETIDGSVAVQKALSCVFRSGQIFGTTYLIDLLLGNSNERIIQNGHDKLSTFGIGKEFSSSDWRRIYRQLIAQGFLMVDIEGHGSVKLTEKCRPLLRGEQEIEIHKPREDDPTEKAERKKQSAKQILQPWNQPLFDALRDLRMTLAQDQNVPPYVIFHDSTLIAMTETRPTTENEMRYISGVGEQKLERYGEQFMTEIKKHPLPDLLNNTLSDTVKETLFYYNDGLNIDQIAEKRENTTDTIYSHFSDAIAAGAVDPQELLQLEDDEYHLIINTIEFISTEVSKSGAGKRLRPVYEALGEEYNYGVIKCVMASL
ncbi:MAG: DNA helicase RecQ [Gammaproteobacteria bacterium]|nr:DNA helicase RecQ [Gammaproteobacteria bacterium]